MYKRSLRQRFAMHLALGVIVGLVITWIDIQFSPIGLQLEGEMFGWAVYFVGIFLITMTMYGVIAVTYFFHTRNVLGFAILMCIGVFFSFFHIEDVLYYWLSGTPMPEELPWLWETKMLGKTMTRQDVMLMARTGLALTALLILAFIYATRRRRRH